MALVSASMTMADPAFISPGLPQGAGYAKKPPLKRKAAVKTMNTIALKAMILFAFFDATCEPDPLSY